MGRFGGINRPPIGNARVQPTRWLADPGACSTLPASFEVLRTGGLG